VLGAGAGTRPMDSSAHTELGLHAQQHRVHIFRDQSLWITGLDGEIHDETLQGAYYANTRLLSRFALRLNGRSLIPVQVAPARDGLLVAYYHDPHITGDDVYGERSLVVQVTVTAGRGFHLDIDARNHSPAPLTGELSLLLNADFADLEEPRAGNRLQQAPVQRVCALEETGELRFIYGHPDLDEAAILRFTPAPRCQDDCVGWTLELAPQADWHTCLEVTPVHQGVTLSPVAHCYGAIAPDDADHMPAWQEHATRLETSNDSVRRGYERAVADLEALALHDGPPAERPAFAAGIPFYHNPFGRDLLTTSWQALLATPALLHSAILTCARYQGTTTDDFRDEQPGRIIQQVRTGPLNQLNINPRGRYYSDYASPGDFLIMLGQHLMWTGDRDVLRAHLPAAERVLAWLDREADLDGDGFYEYQTRSLLGDRNQGWKDSEHAILDTDGNDPPLPIATCEVQGYVYAAKQQLGAAMLALGRVRDGTRLLRQAGELKRRFNRAFWMPDEGFVALALDRHKRQVRTIASNAAHCLATGIVDAVYAPAVAGRLMAPDMFSGWGIRTLSADHPAYNPFSYHLGSVWPVEQATAAFGMKRYGFGQHTNAIAQGTFDLAERYERHRLPEAVGGLPRDHRHPFPGVYPKSCWPQAWSAGAIIMMLQAMLGLRPVAPLGLLLVYPELPEWLPDVTLRDLRVGRSTLTIDFRRQPDGATDFRVRERHGPVRVLRAPPESSVRHSFLSRVMDPLGTIVIGRA
jgi:glycogen debranching enzyme